jgi:antitoxin (DNA-binding transcriptional repressor) of toxin-antitoxin stability system
MRKVTVRQLQREFKKIECLLQQGEEIQITKCGRVIARLVQENTQSRPPLPDFRARLRAIYGDKVFKVSGAELIRRDRNRY